MIRNKTKILATVGPACYDHKVLQNMVDSGVNAFRINMSHGTYQEKKALFDQIKKLKNSDGNRPSILTDLAGPKIRIKDVKDDMVLKTGQTMFIANDQEADDKKIIISSGFSFGKISEGGKIIINDGRIHLEVIEKMDEHLLKIKVVNGGKVKKNKGVNFPGVALDMPSLTKQDVVDLALAIDERTDWVALSFVRSPYDKEAIDAILKDKGVDLPVMAKIEKWEALEHLDEIINTFDGVMVARGDLGVEIPQEQVPLVQKKIIRLANKAGKPVVIATQLLETMVESPTPTRAEVSDIANAIFDGTDALLVTGETAIGKFPEKVINVLSRVVLETEKTINFDKIHQPISHQQHTADAISHATCQIANDMGIGIILTLTHSGSTARMIARYKPSADIIALTPIEDTYRQLSIIWGVTPNLIDQYSSSDDIPNVSSDFIRKNNLLDRGEHYVVTGGVPVGVSGTTNYLFVQKA